MWVIHRSGRSVTRKRMMVFSGTAHPELAHEICEHLGIRLTDAQALPVLLG